MSVPDSPCPNCNGVLQPLPNRPLYRECANCGATFIALPEEEHHSFVDSLLTAVIVIGKIALILIGLGFLGLAIVFAGCVLTNNINMQ